MLVDGLGQLGSALAKYIISGTVYHTWNVFDKSYKAQLKCYTDYISFCNNNPLPIIFISTRSDKDNYYVEYKRKAEMFTICSGGDVIRLPILIGKGVFSEFKNYDKPAYGVMEVITIKDACDAISNICRNKLSNTIHDIKGIEIPAYIVKEIILSSNL